MIDTDSIENWRVWTEKTEGGVNRGYTQAYHNVNRRDYSALISTRSYENLDKASASLSMNTEAGSDDKSEHFEGTYGELDELVERAEERAREFMEEHPCPRRDGHRTGIELLTDVHNALRENRCPPQHDADFAGWGAVGGSPGFQITPLVDRDGEWTNTDTPTEAERLLIRLEVDGKESGLAYREWKESDSDGEIRRLHEPRNPESIIPRIKQALLDAGIQTVHDIKKGGHQTHWDHKVGYRAVVSVPDDLELPDGFRRRRTSLF